MSDVPNCCKEYVQVQSLLPLLPGGGEITSLFIPMPMLNADIRDFIYLLCYVQRGCSSKGNKINIVILLFSIVNVNYLIMLQIDLLRINNMMTLMIRH